MWINYATDIGCMSSIIISAISASMTVSKGMLSSDWGAFMLNITKDADVKKATGRIHEQGARDQVPPLIVDRLFHTSDAHPTINIAHADRVVTVAIHAAETATGRGLGSPSAEGSPGVLSGMGRSLDNNLDWFFNGFSRPLSQGQIASISGL